MHDKLFLEIFKEHDTFTASLNQVDFENNRMALESCFFNCPIASNKVGNVTIFDTRYFIKEYKDVNSFSIVPIYSFMRRITHYWYEMGMFIKSIATRVQYIQLSNQPLGFIFESLFFIFVRMKKKVPFLKNEEYEDLTVISFAGLAPLELLKISTFYRPDISNYPTVDFILVDYNEKAKKKYKIIFIQVTIENPTTKFNSLNRVMERTESVLSSRMFCAWFELLKNSKIKPKNVEFDFWLMHAEDKSFQSSEAPAKCFDFPNKLSDFIVQSNCLAKQNI